MNLQDLTKRKTFATFALPLAVVVPLLVASYLIGAGAIWLWAGIGIGMAWVNFSRDKAEQAYQAKIVADALAEPSDSEEQAQ